MKYYCKNCGTEFIVQKKWEQQGGLFLCDCQVCGSSEDTVKIPDFEPVSEWENRTGREYPGTAPVYIWIVVLPVTGWSCNSYLNVKRLGRNKNECIVATEAGAPPNDWRPEEDKN